MPKIETQLSTERDAEIQRRIVRAQTAIAELSPLGRHEVYHTKQSAARHAAIRCGLANTEVGAIETPTGWVGVVYLRSDQSWMIKIVHEQGCRVGEKP